MSVALSRIFAPSTSLIAYSVSCEPTRNLGHGIRFGKKGPLVALTADRAVLSFRQFRGIDNDVVNTSRSMFMPAERVTSKSPWHVIFVIDDSASMSGQPSTDVNEAMETMIAEMDLLSQGLKPYFKISVISFGSDSRVITKLNNERQIDLNAVTKFGGNSGSTNAAAALTDAYNILAANGGEATDFDPFVFFLSDGAPDNQNLALDAGQRIKTLSIPAGTPRIVTIGMGAPNDAFMSALATNPELYKKLTKSSEIKDLLPAVGTIAGTKAGAEGVVQAIMQL